MKDNLKMTDYNYKIKNYLNECYFDINSVPLGKSPLIIDEAHLAKMLTRIVVSAATIATTTISLRQYFKDIAFNYRKNKL